MGASWRHPLQLSGDPSNDQLTQTAGHKLGSRPKTHRHNRLVPLPLNPLKRMLSHLRNAIVAAAHRQLPALSKLRRRRIPILGVLTHVENSVNSSGHVTFLIGLRCVRMTRSCELRPGLHRLRRQLTEPHMCDSTARIATAPGMTVFLHRFHGAYYNSELLSHCYSHGPSSAR